MTETSPVCTISYPRAELQGASDDEKYRRAAMAGVPAPLVDLRVQGEAGELPWDGRSVGDDAVPRTSTGKFWKLKLRERFPR